MIGARRVDRLEALVARINCARVWANRRLGDVDDGRLSDRGEGQ